MCIAHFETKESSLSRRNRKDKVTVTFHYLTRSVEEDNGEPKTVPITIEEFKAAMGVIAATPPIDTSTQAGVDKLRFGSTVPVSDLTEVEPNLFFGSYKGIYTGHSYENTARGLIPYDSASLRKFYFIAYWSQPKGRVYIATQYLGQFGDYTGLKNTVIRAFSNRKGLDAHSFRNAAVAFQKVIAKEITVEYLRKSSESGKSNAFSQGGIIVIRKAGNAEEFAEATRKRLFSIIDSPKDKIKKAVAKILREDQLIDVNDEDILNCTVLAEVDGSDRRYHFITESSFATPFPIGVGMSVDGHPEPTQLQTAMRKMLKDEILKKSENV
jgi:hypothetical protein